jgi:hypothetical protein
MYIFEGRIFQRKGHTSAKALRHAPSTVGFQYGFCILNHGFEPQIKNTQGKNCVCTEFV